ncbi:DUF397 domain-containing protein [Streptomyces olivoreticuli]
MNAEINWQKSSFSGKEGEQCVEIAARADMIWMRESDTPGATARANRVGFAAFLAGVKTGRFDS